jgi:hypothetical protein
MQEKLVNGILLRKHMNKINTPTTPSAELLIILLEEYNLTIFLINLINFNKFTLLSQLLIYLF